ncbi:MAG: hypothetical protein COB73_08150 [Flavobacteriaceae bacterium]|nr:MAG: hypothetical protein COB73_08150 [Flavobacteriaceae bacterium]
MNKYGMNSTANEVMQLLAKKTRILRKQKKLTQKKLSDKSGVAYASIKKFESTGIISLESFLKLCNALGRLNELEAILKVADYENKSKLFDI